MRLSQNSYQVIKKFAADKENWPLQRGFDRYFGHLSGSCSYWDPFTLLSNNSNQSINQSIYKTILL